MKPFNKQAANLKRNLKQNNMKPLLFVFMVIVLLSLTYKSVSNVQGVGNNMFKEGYRTRGNVRKVGPRRRRREGMKTLRREGADEEQF